MPKIELINRDTGKTFSGFQYIQGAHPPPPGVRVVMGLHGVVARASTVHGTDSIILPNDWLVTMKDGSVEIFTDSYVRAQYKITGESEDDPDKPVRLG